MTYVITRACIDVMDQSCVEVCPVDCIYAEDEDRMCYVEPDECIDCGVCEAACPVGAIFKDSETPSQVQQFIELNAAWFKDKAQVRSRVADIAENEHDIT